MTCSFYLNTDILSETDDNDYAAENTFFESGTGMTPYHMQSLYSHRAAGVGDALINEEYVL
jgi:hypothetical protein